MISLCSIDKSFGEKPVLAGFSLDVAQGQTVCLLGPSGCGKTTLLNIVAGLDTPDAGSIDTDSNRVGYLFQNRDLLPWYTVLENAALGLEFQRMEKTAARDIARDYLGRLCLKDAGALYPSQISGGMKQRVALAQVLAAAPDILLLDEPLNGLDINTRRVVSHVIKDSIRTRKACALIVTHSVEEAMFLADRIIILTACPARIAADIDTHDGGNNVFERVMHAFAEANPPVPHAHAA